MIVTGSVALGVPLINGWVTALQSKRAARSQHLDELRSVLDEAAVALLGFMDSVPIEGDKIDRQAIEERVIPFMRAALQKIWEQEARIGVRLGVNHEVSKAYRYAHDCAGNYFVYVRDALRPAREKGDVDIKEISEYQAAANARFFNLAAALVGPERA